MFDFFLELAYEVISDKFPKVGEVVDHIIEQGVNDREKAEGIFEKGYQYACRLSYEDLEREVKKRREDNKQDVYTLGMMQRFKELYESNKSRY